MTDTLPLTLMGALSGHPDAVTGLMHRGDGRYYDPTLGRPLQPNPAGGPPAVPQALNRYAATPAGQPGVYQAAQGDGFHNLPYAVSFGKTLALELASEYKVGIFGRQVVEYSGSTAIAIQASTSSLNRSRDAIEAAGGVFQRSIDNTRRLIADGSRYSKYRFRTDIYRFEASLDEIEKLVTQVGTTDGLVQSGGWRAVATVDSLGTKTSRVKRFSKLEFQALAVGTDVLLEFGFQYYFDSKNPYLSFEQRVARASISGIGGGSVSAIGGLLGGALGCGPAAPACIAVGAVAGSYFWEQVKPTVFQVFPGLVPTRNLAPLN